jgi:hypothetical protein
MQTLTNPHGMVTKQDLVKVIKKDRQKGIGGIYFWHHNYQDFMALDSEQQYDTYVKTMKEHGCKLIRTKQLTPDNIKELGILNGTLEIWQAQDENGESIDLGIPMDPVAMFCGFFNGTSEFTVLRINKHVKS